MSISSIQGHGGHFARRGKNCQYCEIDSADLLNDMAGEKRCLVRMYHQRHLFPPNSTSPFKCPSCGAAFNSQADIDQEKAPANMLKYVREHAGAYWHIRPLLDLEPCKYIVCCLHLLLSLTKLVFKTCILPMLVTEDVAQLLNSMLLEIGVCIPKAKKVAQDSNKSQSQRIKFTGAECLKLLEFWDCIVDRLVESSGRSEEVQTWATRA